MAVHPDGSGTSWTEAAPDVNQPHGLDYRSLQDLRKGIRKRAEQEHSDFGDLTIGMIHTPGGCAVLGIEDGTATVVADGTLKGHGIVWDGTEALWCSTAAAGASTTGDFTIVQMNPNTQWKGGDVTWAGQHQFDASGYFTQPVEFSKVDLTGNLYVDSSTDVSDLYSAGDVSILGNLSCNSKADFLSDVSVGGVIKVDGTATQFGGTAGIGLFYDPTAYGGGETSTLGNGLIIKMGILSAVPGGGTKSVTFVSAFPNGVISGVVSSKTTAAITSPATVDLLTTTTLTGRNNDGTARNVYWIAIGY